MSDNPSNFAGLANGAAMPVFFKPEFSGNLHDVRGPRSAMASQGKAHACNVLFCDFADGYREKTITVFEDGFDNNSASKFIDLFQPSSMTEDVAVKLGKYRLFNFNRGRV